MKYYKVTVYDRAGHQLVVFEEDFTHDNLAHVTDIRDYSFC